MDLCAEMHPPSHLGTNAAAVHTLLHEVLQLAVPLAAALRRLVVKKFQAEVAAKNVVAKKLLAKTVRSLASMPLAAAVHTLLQKSSATGGAHPPDKTTLMFADEGFIHERLQQHLIEDQRPTLEQTQLNDCLLYTSPSPRD